MGILALFRRQNTVPNTSAMSTLSAEILTRDEGRALEMRAVANAHSIRSMVAQGMQIRGHIVSKTGAAVDGTIIGSVSVVAINAALLIRAGASVTGPVRAPICMIAGTVTGNITARFVRLYPGARVIGEIHAERLIVDDGALVQNASMLAGPSSGADSDSTVALWRHSEDVAQGASALVDSRTAQGTTNRAAVGAG